jgi:hypothetical protein
MRINQHQLQMLLQTLRDTLVFHETTVFSYDNKQRADLYDAIINQQSSKLVEVE